MHKGFCNPFRSVTCDAHVQMPYVILKHIVNNSLPSCCFQLLFLRACAVIDSLRNFCFSDGHREAAHAQMKRRRGMTCKSFDCVRFVFFLDRPRLLVIFAWTAFREPSQRQEYIRDSVAEQACKKTSVENNKAARHFTPKYTKFHKKL